MLTLSVILVVAAMVIPFLMEAIERRTLADHSPRSEAVEPAVVAITDTTPVAVVSEAPAA